MSGCRDVGLGVAAERAPLGHAWPVGAHPPYGCRNEGTPAEQGPNVGDSWSAPFAEAKEVDRQGKTGLSIAANAYQPSPVEACEVLPVTGACTVDFASSTNALASCVTFS